MWDEFLHKIRNEAREGPGAVQLPARPSADVEVDLTGATIFVTSAALRQELVDIFEQHAGGHVLRLGADQKMYIHGVMRKLLRAFAGMHQWWSHKEYLTDAQVGVYVDHVSEFRKCVLWLGWVPSPYVHWVCAHSGYYMGRVRTLYGFSSIPTEHRHQRYKRDTANSFMGWRFENPKLSVGWLRRAIELDALDQGLAVYAVTGRAPWAGLVPIRARAGRKRKRRHRPH